MPTVGYILLIMAGVENESEIKSPGKGDDETLLYQYYMCYCFEPLWEVAIMKDQPD